MYLIINLTHVIPVMHSGEPCTQTTRGVNAIVPANTINLNGQGRTFTSFASCL